MGGNAQNRTRKEIEMHYKKSKKGIEIDPSQLGATIKKELTTIEQNMQQNFDSLKQAILTEIKLTEQNLDLSKLTNLLELTKAGNHLINDTFDRIRNRLTIIQTLNL